MAELRLEQLNERDRLYNILDQEYDFSYIGKDNRGLPIEKTYRSSSRFKNLKTNHVISGIVNRPDEILLQIERLKKKIGTNIFPEEWNNYYNPEISNKIGYDAIHQDLQTRRLGLYGWAFPYVPSGQAYGGLQRMKHYRDQKSLDLAQAEIDYLELVYLENFGVKQMTITSTFKEKLDQEKLRSQIELETLQAQLGVAQKSLETETLESESAKLDFQQSHTELLTFNKLINKIEELHEPEPVKTGFHLESIDAKKLLVVGLGLIGVVILLIVVKK